MGRVTKTKAGTYSVTLYDENRERLRKIFKHKYEAEAYVNKYEAEKNQQRLLQNKLIKPRKELIKAIEDFAITKMQLRPKSRQKYDLVLRQFASFIDTRNITFIDEFTFDHASEIYKLLVQPRLVNRGGKEIEMTPKPKTVNFYLATIKALFEAEVIKGVIDRNPMIHIKNLKEENRRPEFYSEDEIDRFFKQDMPYAYRFAFIGLLTSGMRINELCNLTWSDLDEQRRLLRIRTKDGFDVKTDNAERSIPLGDIIYEMILAESKNRRSSEYIFASIQGSKLSDRRMLEACKEIGEKAGIKERVYLHKWRHTFATQLVRRGVPIEVLQKLMGHSSIIETLVYTHVRSEELHEQVKLIDQIIRPFSISLAIKKYHKSTP
ncbi:MAG: tyrosine-type recombinase/integrase [bacterium]